MWISTSPESTWFCKSDAYVESRSSDVYPIPAEYWVVELRNETGDCNKGSYHFPQHLDAGLNWGTFSGTLPGHFFCECSTFACSMLSIKIRYSRRCVICNADFWMFSTQLNNSRIFSNVCWTCEVSFRVKFSLSSRSSRYLPMGISLVLLRTGAHTVVLWTGQKVMPQMDSQSSTANGSKTGIKKERHP